MGMAVPHHIRIQRRIPVDEAVSDQPVQPAEVKKAA